MTDRDRRLEVSEAAWRVIVREGLARTSMRAIAQELGCTTGVVTHHFRDKSELLRFALQQVTQHLQVAMVAAAQSAQGPERLVAMLATFLPQSLEETQLLQVWLAFLGAAVGQPSLLHEHQHSAAQLRALVVQELRTLAAAQMLRADLDPEQEANILLALVNGLSLDSLIQAQRLQPAQQRAALQRYVQGLSPGTGTSRGG